MILQALYELAESERLSEDLDFQQVPVAWHIILAADGRLVNIASTADWVTPEGKKAPVRVVPVERVPRRVIGRAGMTVKPDFLVDNAQYVFGLTAPGKKPSKQAAECPKAFLKKVQECAAATGDPAVAAVARFLENVASGAEQVQWRDDWGASDLFSFAVYPDVDEPVHQREAVENYWRQQRTQDTPASSAGLRCLVTGNPVAGKPPLFPLIKRVPGGPSTGVGLVSFNFSASESHGWKGNENAPISREAAEACATALNRLMHPAYPHPDPNRLGDVLPVRHYRITPDTVVAFWAPHSKNQHLLDHLGPGLEVSEDEEARNTTKDNEAMQQVRATYGKVWKGQAPHLDDETPFYLMTVTGTRGRAIVRDWVATNMRTAFDNLAAFFEDIDIVRNAPPKKGCEHPPALPIPLLMRALAVHGDSGRLPDALAAELFQCALVRRRMPEAILHRALERARVEAGENEWMDKQYKDARAALVKACLIRNHDQKELTRAMNPENKNPAYLLGQLLALLERTQHDALGDVNATIVDRYFKRACTTPLYVFRHLLQTNQSHLKKLKRDNTGLFVVRKREIDSLINELGDAWPRNLNLEEQGLFLLGYHQRRHALWQKRDADNAA
jgi:CRISPR-associated protein Csd1